LYRGHFAVEPSFRRIPKKTTHQPYASEAAMIGTSFRIVALLAKL
jgi:hypothetical protein